MIASRSMNLTSAKFEYSSRMSHEPLAGGVREVFRRTALSETIRVTGCHVNLVEFPPGIQHRIRHTDGSWYVPQQAGDGMAAGRAMQKLKQRLHRFFGALLSREGRPFVISSR